MLNSLDLFTGVGGITIALEGLCNPIAYCDIDKNAQQVLKSRMESKSLPEAPIFSDVKTLTKDDVLERVDIIVGGWPCQDISIIGKKKGMGEGTRSGLIHEVYRLVDEFNPSALFLENVPEAINVGLGQMVNEFVIKRKYNMRWCIVPANAVGAPHLRKRFFCLITKPDFNHTFKDVAYTPKTWANDSEPTRMILNNREGAITRIKMMGNAVVPDCVRAAFMTLFSGFHVSPCREILSTQTIQFQQVNFDHMVNININPMEQIDAQYPKWGLVTTRENNNTSDIVYTLQQIPKLPVVDFDFTLNPAVFVRTRSNVDKGAQSPLLTEPKRLARWATPRRSGLASNILTVRTCADLPTRVRFEVNTPNELRTGVINPEFVEWIMGYDIGWTKTQTQT